MKYGKSALTAAEPAALWAVVHDVERWPEWIAVYEEVRRTDTAQGPVGLGGTAYVKQQGLAGGTWTVTELEDGMVFAWESRQPGVRLVGRHRVTPEPGGGSRLTLEFEMSGWLSGLLGVVLGRRVRSYVDLECARLTEVASEHETA